MTGLTVSLHAKTAPTVEVHDLSYGADHLAVVRFGDDTTGVTVIGERDTLAVVLVDALRQLQDL